MVTLTHHLPMYLYFRWWSKELRDSINNIPSSCRGGKRLHTIKLSCWNGVSTKFYFAYWNCIKGGYKKDSSLSLSKHSSIWRNRTYIYNVLVHYWHFLTWTLFLLWFYVLIVFMVWFSFEVSVDVPCFKCF